jgi:hypothetical protein
MALYRNSGSAGGGQIHALLIGAGAYPVTTGMAPALSLKALPGVEQSTRLLGDWLIANSADLILPVGSVEMLLSTETPDPRWQGQPCLPPSLAEMDKAVRRWLARCEEDAEGSIALVYFGGHGFFRDRLHFFAADALDFGDPASQTVRLDDFVVGMSMRQCRRQIFIFDCCQDLPDAVQKRLVGTGGTPLVSDPDGRPGRVEHLIIKATSPGLKALARAETFLVKALLQVLDNDGGDYFDERWWVTPASITQTINRVGTALYEEEWPEADIRTNASTLERLRRLAHPPLVDVTLVTAPARALPEAEVQLRDQETDEVAQNENGEPCRWVRENRASIRTKVPSKPYVAEAAFATDETRYRAGRKGPIWPRPFRDSRITLDVTRQEPG